MGYKIGIANGDVYIILLDILKIYPGCYFMLPYQLRKMVIDAG